MLQQVQVHLVSPQYLAHQLSVKHWWIGDISRALFTAKSCSPTALLQETHISLSICCHMQIFRYSQAFLLRKDSFWWWGQSLLIYLTWETANVQLPVILLFSHPWNFDNAVCIPSSSNHPMLILMLDLGMLSCSVQGQMGDKEGTYMLFCGSQQPCRNSLGDGGRRSGEQKGERKKSFSFFLLWHHLRLLFLPQWLPSLPYIHAGCSQGQEWVTPAATVWLHLSKHTWPISCSSGFWLGFLFQGGKGANTEQTGTVSLSAAFCAVVPLFSASS